MDTILKESGSSGIDADLGPIYVGTVRVLFAGISPFVVNHLNPKWLFVTCQCISSLAMSTIGTYVYLQAYYPDYLSDFSWIPLVMIIIIVIMRASGILPIMYVLMNELYPTEIRTQSIGHIVWKLLKMSHLNFGILAFSTNFCPIKTDLSGNTVWPQALVLKKLAKLTIFGIFN